MNSGFGIEKKNEKKMGLLLKSNPFWKIQLVSAGVSWFQLMPADFS